MFFSITIRNHKMLFAFLSLLLYFDNGLCFKWPKGIIHYSINSKDYDQHSVDEILSAMSKVQQAICLKFFKMPFTGNVSDTKILYINNPMKSKECKSNLYDFSGPIVPHLRHNNAGSFEPYYNACLNHFNLTKEMTVGYKCINQKDIARSLVDMIKSTVHQGSINSYDLVKTFDDKNTNATELISLRDRDFINAHYREECNSLEARFPQPGLTNRRAMDDPLKTMSEENIQFYNDLIWPYGIVMWSVERKTECDEGEKAAQNRIIDQHLDHIRKQMNKIMLHSCIVFQEIVLETAALMPKNFIIFTPDENSEEDPHLGFLPGNQTLNLNKISEESPLGHKAHTINALMRILGVPMMSNRFDRDNYVKIRWDNVAKGKEHLLERMPEAAWIKNVNYDFSSVTHATAGYVRDPAKGITANTVEPIQDRSWRHLLSMGRGDSLSYTDKKMLDLMYKSACDERMNE